MTDDQQPEEMRPIPDGGLKDAMPGWLKRPPAWRNMPTPEQRHERTLPDPDTREIDPRSLVDVSDLPQWLQTIAARSEEDSTESDHVVEHAIEQIQAAARVPEPVVEEPVVVEVEQIKDPKPEPVDATIPTSPKKELGLMTDESTPEGASRPPYLIPLLITAFGILVLIVGLSIYYF